MRRASLRGRPALWVGLCAALLGIACGGSGRRGGLGSVAILVTDAPSHHFDRIELRVSRVELLGAERVPIFSGSEAIDLLDLEAFSNPFFVASDVPVGEYQKVRLTVEEMTLSREVAGTDGSRVLEQWRPRLPGDGVIDVVPRSPFFVVPDTTLLLEIDVDAEKSIHAEERSPEAYDVRPIAFVREVGASDGLAKRARVRGRIREFMGPWAFVLCSEEIRATRLDVGPPGGIPSVPSCLTVNVPHEDPSREAETRTAVEGLVEGDVVTAVGRLRLERAALALAPTRGKSDADAPFVLADLSGADLQLDASRLDPGPVASSPLPRRRDAGATLSGDVAGLDPSGRSFRLAHASGTSCVEVAAGARLLLLADDGRVASSTEIPLDDLVAGQTVEAFGRAGAPCFRADAVVAFAG